LVFFFHSRNLRFVPRAVQQNRPENVPPFFGGWGRNVIRSFAGAFFATEMGFFYDSPGPVPGRPPATPCAGGKNRHLPRRAAGNSFFPSSLRFPPPASPPTGPPFYPPVVVRPLFGPLGDWSVPGRVVPPVPAPSGKIDLLFFPSLLTSSIFLRVRGPPETQMARARAGRPFPSGRKTGSPPLCLLGEWVPPTRALVTPLPPHCRMGGGKKH